MSGRSKPAIDLVPQPVDVHVHHIRQAIKIIIPDMLLNHRPAHHLAGMPHQVMQKCELLGRKLDSLARSARPRASPDRARDQRLSRAPVELGPTPQDDPDPRHQFGKRKRLDE